MEAKLIREMVEAYASVYNQDLNEIRAQEKDYYKMKKPPVGDFGPIQKPTKPSKPPVKRGGPMDEMMRGSRPDSGSSSGSSGGSGGLLNRVVDTATSVIKPQVQKQANKKFGPLGGMVAGGEVDKIGSQVKSGDYGGALNRAVQGAGRLFNSVDMFDIIKGYLLDEGYADTEQAALAIMANMSEEWKQSIVEDVYKGPPKKPGMERRPNMPNARDIPASQKPGKKNPGPPDQPEGPRGGFGGPDQPEGPR